MVYYGSFIKIITINNRRDFLSITIFSSSFLQYPVLSDCFWVCNTTTISSFGSGLESRSTDLLIFSFMIFLFINGLSFCATVRILILKPSVGHIKCTTNIWEKRMVNVLVCCGFRSNIFATPTNTL